jgi:hypothetical protein
MTIIPEHQRGIFIIWQPDFSCLTIQKNKG